MPDDELKEGMQRISDLLNVIHNMMFEVSNIQQKVVVGLAERVAKQSNQLSMNAERDRVRIDASNSINNYNLAQAAKRRKQLEEEFG